MNFWLKTTINSYSIKVDKKKGDWQNIKMIVYYRNIKDINIKNVPIAQRDRAVAS